MGKFDCVYRYRRVYSSTFPEGIKISEREDECIPKGQFIPSGVPCNTKCPLYVSRYGKGFKHDEVQNVENN